MKLNEKLIRQLIQLREGEEITAGKFSGKSKEIIEKMVSNGILCQKSRGSKQSLICCPDADALCRHVANKYGIKVSFETYLESLQHDLSRHETLAYHTDEKTSRAAVARHIVVGTYQPLQGKVGNKLLDLYCSEGYHLNITDIANFTIEADVTVIGVENMENFKFRQQQQHLFEGMKVLFVSRSPYPATVREWLKNLPNAYLHFGDFDLAGIHIYLHEFHKHLPAGRCRFFIPPGIEQMILAHGNRERYDRQLMQYSKTDFSADPETAPLAALIHRHKRALAQEYLITPC